MERISRGERNPPVGGQDAAILLEQAAADDFGGFRLGGHHDRSAHAIQQLLEPFIIRLVFRRHFQLGGWNRNG